MAKKGEVIFSAFDQEANDIERREGEIEGVIATLTDEIAEVQGIINLAEIQREENGEELTPEFLAQQRIQLAAIDEIKKNITNLRAELAKLREQAAQAKIDGYEIDYIASGKKPAQG